MHAACRCTSTGSNRVHGVAGRGAGDGSDDEEGEVPDAWAADVHALQRIADNRRTNVEQADVTMRLLRHRALARATPEHGPRSASRWQPVMSRSPHVIV